MIDDLAQAFFVLRAVGIADNRLCACCYTKIDADEEVEDVDVDGHSRNAILAGKFNNGDIKENRYDTRGKLGEHFAGAVEAGLDKVPFVPVEFGKFQVCFVEFKINQTHQRGDGDRGDRRDRGAENTPA